MISFDKHFVKILPKLYFKESIDLVILCFDLNSLLMQIFFVKKISLDNHLIKILPKLYFEDIIY